MIFIKILLNKHEIHVKFNPSTFSHEYQSVIELIIFLSIDLGPYFQYLAVIISTETTLKQAKSFDEKLFSRLHENTIK